MDPSELVRFSITTFIRSRHEPLGNERFRKTFSLVCCHSYLLIRESTNARNLRGGHDRILQYA